MTFARMTGLVRRSKLASSFHEMTRVKLKMVTRVLETEIRKPKNDVREYRAIVLSNELRVLLIRDPDTNKGAAAMDVNVGYFSDPEELEGLAHFLEHMLFYASKKYPEEGAYKLYLAEHGGHGNASTSAEHTTFRFAVNQEGFEETLDRFSQFFICPLLSADATSREIKAIDAECSRNMSLDPRRLWLVQKHITSKDHPYHKFGSGNLETLETRPKARGIDTLKELVKFYETHYSANLMTLVLSGKKTLDELQRLAEDKFSSVKNSGKEAPRFLGQPCLPEHLQIVVKCVPVREHHVLELIWPVRPRRANDKEGALTYLSSLLGHEADGSLFALLKFLGWASSLETKLVNRSFHFAFLTLHIALTEAGQDHMEEIVSLTFQYIRFLQLHGIESWLYEEIRSFRATQFDFWDKAEHADYVKALAISMQLFSPEDWIAGSVFLDDFDEEAISSALQEFQPENVRIFWSSKEFEGKTTHTEPWFGTPFIVERINEDLLKEWKSAAIHPRLHLPSVNEFIATDFSIHDRDPEVKHPIMVRNTAMSRLWYKPDTLFQSPKAKIYLQFTAPETSYSTEAILLTHIFAKLLNDHLNEYAYYATIAGLSYTISRISEGFEVIVAGFDEKLHVLVAKIMEKITSFEVREDRFDIVKESVRKAYINIQFQQPLEQAHYNLHQLIDYLNRNRTEYLQVLESLQAQTLSSFVPRILSRVHIEAYIAGNMTRDEAEAVMDLVENSLLTGTKFKVGPLLPSEQKRQRTVRFESGSDWQYCTAGLNEDDKNSAILIYLQVGSDEPRNNALLQLFVLNAKEPYYNQLRTLEQLGYVVRLQQKSSRGIHGVQMIVQSTVKDPKRLDSRVESFLSSHRDNLLKMTEADFKEKVKTLIRMKREKYKNLNEECAFYIKEISNGTLLFDRVEIEISALEALEKEDLLKFYDQKIASGAPDRRKLSIQIYSSQHAPGIITEQKPLEDSHIPVCPSSTSIKDIPTFKLSQSFYGLPPPHI